MSKAAKKSKAVEASCTRVDLSNKVKSVSVKKPKKAKTLKWAKEHFKALLPKATGTFNKLRVKCAKNDFTVGVYGSAAMPDGETQNDFSIVVKDLLEQAYYEGYKDAKIEIREVLGVASEDDVSKLKQRVYEEDNDYFL